MYFFTDVGAGKLSTVEANAQQNAYGGLLKTANQIKTII